MLWSVVWLSPLRVAIKRLIQLSIIEDEHPPAPHLPDRNVIQLIVEGNAALVTCLLKKSDIPVKDYATLWSSQPPLSNHLLGPRGWQKSNKKLKIEYI